MSLSYLDKRTGLHVKLTDEPIDDRQAPSLEESLSQRATRDPVQVPQLSPEKANDIIVLERTWKGVINALECS